MDNESIRNKDTLQLQQIIIFLKSELAKNQNEISMLKKNDYYSLVISLERENSQLANQKKELSMELMKLRKAYEKELYNLHKDIQFRENQRIKQISSIEALVKIKKNLQTENLKLSKALEEAHQKLIASKINLLTPIEKDFRKSIENINNTLHDFIKKNDQQLSTIHEELIKIRSESNDINHYLLEEIKNKNNQLDILMGEIDELKEQHNKKNSTSLNDKAIIHSVLPSHVDNQIQKVLTQSMNFETQLDEKLRILDDLEHKLIQLANDIDNK